jgi:hypothetical protein
LLVVVGAIAALAPRAEADTLNVEMYPFTGEIRFANASAAPFSFFYYAINSSSSSLNGNPAIWSSVTDDYDASGNGFIDPVNDWSKFSSSPAQLAEGVFVDPGGTLAAFRAVSLGTVWNAPAFPAISNLSFQVLEADYGFSTINARLAIDGDYNWDGVVDAADYVVWKQNFGETATIGALRADGNLNGFVDAADYTVWRNNFGLSLPGAGSGTEELAQGASFVISSDVVPEPSTAGLLLIGAASLSLLRRRRIRWSACGR